MKSYSKLRGILRVTIVGALMGLSSVVSVNAQTYNVITVANFSLTGVRQNGGGVTSVRMSNKDIIAALNDSGRFNFGSSAKIVLISFESELPTVGVRERSGTNVVTTDISGFFNVAEDGEIHSSNHLTSYAVYEFHFDNHNGTSFDVSGLTTLKAGNISGRGFGPLERDKQLNAAVNGPGSVGGDEALFRGTMSAGSATAEPAG